MSMSRSIQLLFFCYCGLARAFLAPVVRRSFIAPPCDDVSSSSSLWGKLKRGKLIGQVDEAVSRPKKAASKKTKAAKKAGSAPSGDISPALAEWMASQQEGEEVSSSSNASVASEVSRSFSDKASTFTSFETDEEEEQGKKGKKGRKGKSRVKQSARKEAEDARDERVEVIVEDLEELLEGGKASVTDIMGVVRELLSLPTANFKQLTAGSQRQDFRLGWAGSDDAVCCVGTGLHKVPLARLQEVFLSFPGRNRVEMLEVIRILGPFPNIKNTLQGQSTFTRQDDAVEWELTWDSMVDGTGKEILAGKEENIRRINLQVYFSSPSVVVAVVPPDESDVSIRRADPLEEDGKHVLLFVREESLQGQLEILRVA